MRILSIDPASKTGFAYLGEAGRISGTWDLSTRRDESTGMKLLRLESKLVEFAKLGVDLIVYESPALRTKYPLALVSHAKLVGVIERFCERRKIPSRGYAPTEIKMSVGKGNAGKPAVVAAVRAKYGYDGHDHNEADAIALLELARSVYDTEEADRANPRRHAITDETTPF